MRSLYYHIAPPRNASFHDIVTPEIPGLITQTSPVQFGPTKSRLTTAAHGTTDAESATASHAAHPVLLHQITHSGPAAADDRPVEDNPAVALHNPVAHTSLAADKLAAADTLAQESLDTIARLEIGPSSPPRQRLERFEPARPHVASCGCG
jgi:hypothetical protein